MQTLDPIRVFPAANRQALVVENDAALASLLALLLQGQGYDVIVAADGRAGARLIEQLAPPSLVLLETILPYQGGFELLKQVRAAGWDDAVAVMLSNNAGGMDAQRARQAGADACLVKPLRPEALLPLLRRPRPRQRVMTGAMTGLARAYA